MALHICIWLVWSIAFTKSICVFETIHICVNFNSAQDVKSSFVTVFKIEFCLQTFLFIEKFDKLYAGKRLLNLIMISGSFDVIFCQFISDLSGWCSSSDLIITDCYFNLKKPCHSNFGLKKFLKMVLFSSSRRLEDVVRSNIFDVCEFP